MNDSRRFGGVEYSLLLLVLVAAGGARGWYVGTCAQNGTNAGPLQVQDATAGGWTDLVENLSRDAGFAVHEDGPETPTRVANPAPLYPLALSAVRRVTPDKASMEQWARWLQCGLGAATPGLLFLFARRAFQSNVVALLAGL